MTLVNFDGIPGPTHNYAGLARGNLAAERNAQRESNPRAAARQGLAKMRALTARGYAQAVLPPHERPHLPALRALGFAGDDADGARPRRARSPGAARGVLVGGRDVGRQRRDGQPVGRHRRRPGPPHPGQPGQPLPPRARGRDDDARAARDLRRRGALRRPRPAAGGAAVRRRGCRQPHPARRRRRRAPASSCSSTAGARSPSGPAPTRFPARQTREASEAIARRHGLDPARTVFAQQAPAAIDAGVFHNDVIAVGEGPVLFCHEHAFVDTPAVLAALAARVGPAFRAVTVPAIEVDLRRRRRHVPLQQPAAAAGRRALRAGRAGRRRGAAARRRLPRAPGRRRRPDRRAAVVRPAREHGQRRRPGVPAAARAADRGRARGDRPAGVARRRAGGRPRRVDRPPLSRPPGARRPRRPGAARRVAARARRAHGAAAAAAGLPVPAAASRRRPSAACGAGAPATTRSRPRPASGPAPRR